MVTIYSIRIYIGPEALMDEPYGISVDVFAFAVLICRRFDRSGWSEVKSALAWTTRVVSGKRLPRPSQMLDELWLLVKPPAPARSLIV
jgi:hypothetical protein